MGYALYLAQTGRPIPYASAMKGALSGVVKIRDTDRSGTYRVMYTAQFAGVVYVLHAFQKKANSGIATPKRHLDLIMNRLAEARRDYTRSCRGDT